MGHVHHGAPASKAVRNHVREAVAHISRSAAVREHQEIQEEIFDLRSHNSCLLMALANVILGDDREARQGIASLLDLIDSDTRLARRMVNILEANPDFARKAPDLLERAKRCCSPTFLLAG